MNKNYYMVRAMNSEPKDFKVFFKNKVVAVGWSEVNFTQYENKPKELRSAVNEIYYAKKDMHPPLVGKKLNEVERFDKIKKGDYIIIPYYNSIRMAIAKDIIKYDQEAYELDLANQLEVNYLMTSKDFKTIPRNALSEGLQRRLRVRGSTVSNLYEFKDEIEKIFSQENYTWTSDYEEQENQLTEKVKEKLFQNIQNGTTNLTTGGIGLEYLVKELFECEGYNANVLSKTHFADYGDADVYAVKSDKFQETKILAQVKHHSGYTDDWGLTQLRKIQDESSYADYKFVLITSALIGEKIKENANSFDVNTMDGKELIDWIFEHLDELNIETKTKLGLSLVPQIIE
ncbi:restriction endonuclease [Tenacibaculum tangerinum]|uniref:Restriction endonuclease n=1 Tax=Tenacibaculum tangerinum TaxID=3038772 RepID=A0ABY8L2I3_9FLAO|nr:restriction endonuclease [Tenacibaculum tangerinum]WGH75653.1 restriction endonuclease [Tenacibaculum tangerinum]